MIERLLPRVLIVDDQPEIARALSRVFAADAKVTIAQSGKDALTHIETTSFDLVICDVMMPGMTGPELFEHVKAIDPRTAAKAAAAFGIKIYTIGIGTEGLAPVPVGRGLFGLRYENREVRIDESLLTDIARTTHGRFFRARDAAGLRQIYQEIDQLERVPVRMQTYVRYAEQYRWPLAVAMGGLALELSLLAWRGPLT